MDRDLRLKIENAIEALLAVLDAADDERELDHAEFGMADLDGLVEQTGSAFGYRVAQ